MGGGSFLLAYRKILTNHLSIESSVQAGLKSVLLIMAECELSSTDAMTVSSVVDMRAAAMGIGERHGDATKGMGKGRMYLLDHPFFLGGGETSLAGPTLTSAFTRQIGPHTSATTSLSLGPDHGAGFEIKRTTKESSALLNVNMGMSDGWRWRCIEEGRQG